MSEFNEMQQRTANNSSKWQQFSVHGVEDNDIIPFTIADVDFPYPKALVNALQSHVQDTIFGYGVCNTSYLNSIVQWFKTRHQWVIEPSWITLSPGVVPAISNAIKAFTQKGDGILIMTPVYHPFKITIEALERNVNASPLIENDGIYIIDFADFEQKAQASKVLLLCSPHNPVGRVWTRDELEQIEAICERYNLIVISDEIHCDITMSDHQHIIYAQINESAHHRSIICTSTSKSFNLAGLKNSNIIIPNEALRNQYVSFVQGDGSGTLATNSIGQFATCTAYGQCEGWLDDFLATIEINHDYVASFIKKEIPILRSRKPEGTYLHWIDFRNLGLTDEDLIQFLEGKCKLYLDYGLKFGIEGSGFMRMNVGYPQQHIHAALNRLKIEIEKLQLNTHEEI